MRGQGCTLMQPPPQMMMAAEASKRQTMNMLMTAFLMFGLLALALSGMVWSYGNLGGALSKSSAMSGITVRSSAPN